MKHKPFSNDISALARDVLGYLNFSSGATDPRFLDNLNRLFAALDATAIEEQIWQALGNTLRAELQAARGTSDAFRQVDQAEAVLALVFDAVLPAYRRFHRDLLFHLTDEELFRPFFIGRVCEAVLRQGTPWNDTERIVKAAVRQLNDYIGYRPVATLHNERKIQPYDHEWVGTLPLWIRGAGVAAGPYAELVETALAILDSTDRSLLFEASFDLDQLDELAVDPRAYDFDHPVSKRPNYLFGQWDMHKLDESGASRRYILQQIAIDAMIERLEDRGRLPREQVLFEEAAVLAGTMLMGSGVSGNRPEVHDSSVTLGNLLPKIAVYRDAFYQHLLDRLKGPHAQRLAKEAALLKQPLGGARQHFNHFMTECRAKQLQHVQLAQFFASLGCDQDAMKHATVVSVASARMTCEMQCLMAAAGLALDRGRIDAAAEKLPKIEDLLHRAIECGALVDPWNILGFGGQFSLFPAVENSIYDQRVDDLLDIMSDIFLLYGQIHRAAAAAGNLALQQTLSASLAALASWWDQFASVEVGSLEGVSGQETLESADSVAAAIGAWHKGGAAAGDVAFWREHIEHFTSPKAYALVVDTLLEHRDFVAAMGLLVQWLSQADVIPLVEEDYSFHDLALSWMEMLWEDPSADDESRQQPAPPSRSARRRMTAADASGIPPRQRWEMAKKYLDYLEANADEYWQVPRFEMAAEALGDERLPDGEESGDFDEEDFDEEADDDGLFGAAYENVTFRDSAEDGIEGEMYESGPSLTEFELVGEAERIVSRLNFLTTVAQLWKLSATASAFAESPGRDEALAGWLEQATRNHWRLIELLDCVHRHRIPPPRGSQESLMEYDRRKSVKETLLEEIIQSCVETTDAVRMIRASMGRPKEDADAEEWERIADQALLALLRRDVQELRRLWPGFLAAIGKQPLLYMSVSRGGNPRRIVASRSRQRVIRRLLAGLPRLGLLVETCQLLETAQAMEARHPVGPGAITEFDSIFDDGCRGVIRCLAESAAEWDRQRADDELVNYLEELVDVLLHCWLTHSRRVRLSVLEIVDDATRWTMLNKFIEHYGADLFTQHFMNLGNLRGILQQGVANYLESLREEPDNDELPRLIEDLDVKISLSDAAHWLGVAIEAVVENYGSYIDYNSITTQSDRGEMLYTLLDFLRLKVNYDRQAWLLRPVMLAHEVLVRCGRRRAADVWRSAVAARTAPLAAEHLKNFERLSKRYGMKLPSVAEHLAERFVLPLDIDQLRALVRPVAEGAREGRRPRALEQLRKRIDQFTSRPSGAGYETPKWIEALKNELDATVYQSDEDFGVIDSLIRIPQKRLSPAEFKKQIEQMFDDKMRGTFSYWP